METIKRILRSRTMWTLVFTFAFNGWNAINGAFDPQTTLVVNAVLSTLAGYFKLNPSQKY